MWFWISPNFGENFCYFLKSLVHKVIPKRKKDVAGEIVLITGAGSGLERLMSTKFASLGATVVLWDINEEGNKETCRLIKEKSDVKVFAYKCDCSNRQEVYRVADQVSWFVSFFLRPRKTLHLVCAFTKRAEKFVTDFPQDLYTPPAWFCVSGIWLCSLHKGT